MRQPSNLGADAALTHQKEDLKTWGYDSMSIDDYYDFDDGHPIKNALEDLGISTKKHSEGGDLYSVVWEHEIETEHDGVKYIVRFRYQAYRLLWCSQYEMFTDPYSQLTRDTISSATPSKAL